MADDSAEANNPKPSPSPHRTFSGRSRPLITISEDRSSSKLLPALPTPLIAAADVGFSSSSSPRLAPSAVAVFLLVVPAPTDAAEQPLEVTCLAAASLKTPNIIAGVVSFALNKTNGGRDGEMFILEVQGPGISDDSQRNRCRIAREEAGSSHARTEFMVGRERDCVAERGQKPRPRNWKAHVPASHSHGARSLCRTKYRANTYVWWVSNYHTYIVCFSH